MFLSILDGEILIRFENISLAMYEGLYTDLNAKEEVKRNYTKLKS
jgi:hypothetical protein